MRVELGLSSPQDESASIGKDWEQVQDQQIAYAIRFREKCADAGISPDEVKAIAANAKPSAPPAQAQQPQPPQDQSA